MRSKRPLSGKRQLAADLFPRDLIKVQARSAQFEGLAILHEVYNIAASNSDMLEKVEVFVLHPQWFDLQAICRNRGVFHVFAADQSEDRSWNGSSVGHPSGAGA